MSAIPANRCARRVDSSQQDLRKSSLQVQAAQPCTCPRDPEPSRATLSPDMSSTRESFVLVAEALEDGARFRVLLREAEWAALVDQVSSHWSPTQTERAISTWQLAAAQSRCISRNSAPTLV